MTKNIFEYSHQSYLQKEEKYIDLSFKHLLLLGNQSKIAKFFKTNFNKKYLF